MMFVMINLCRKLGFEAEDTLKDANRKFEDRFRAMEDLASKRGQNFPDLDLQQQEDLWQDVKKSSKVG